MLGRTEAGALAVKQRSYEIAMSGNAELKFLDTKKPANAPDTEAEPGSEG